MYGETSKPEQTFDDPVERVKDTNSGAQLDSLLNFKFFSNIKLLNVGKYLQTLNKIK